MLTTSTTIKMDFVCASADASLYARIVYNILFLRCFFLNHFFSIRFVKIFFFTSISRFSILFFYSHVCCEWLAFCKMQNELIPNTFCCCFISYKFYYFTQNFEAQFYATIINTQRETNQTIR